MKSGNLNFLETSGPLQTCNGTALPLPFTNIELFKSTYTIAVLMVMQKEIDCYQFNINCNWIFKWQLLNRNDKFVTVHNKLWKIPPSTSVHFCSWSGKIVWCSSELIFTFLYGGNSIQNASEKFVSCVQLSLVNFVLNPTPEPKI